MDALADPAAVDFQFGFTGTRPADAARQTGKRRVLVRQARQQILELRQLYLDFSFAAVRAMGKDIQDHLRAVDNFQAGKIADGAHLRGRQFMVKDQQVRADLGGPKINVRQSAPADQIFRIRLRTVLNLCVKDLHPAGGGQLPKFFQRGFSALQRIFFHTDQNGFFRRVNSPAFLPAGKLVFQRGDEG